jgi:hypothetical protein
LNNDAHITIYDFAGRKVYEQALNTRAGVINIDPNLSSGMYMLHIINGDERVAPMKITQL